MKSKAANLPGSPTASRAEILLHAIIAGTAPMTGDAFFRSLVENLAHGLGVRWVFAAECLPDLRARTLAYWNSGAFARNFEYSLVGTPCLKVTQGRTCHVPDKLPEVFPEDHGMLKMGTRSYLGVPLRGSAGHVIGHLVTFENLALQLVFRSHLLCRFSKKGGGAHITRQIAEILCQGHALGNGLPWVQGFLGGSQFIAAINDKGEFAQGPAHLVLFALELIETIDGFLRHHGGLTNAPGRAAFPDARFGQKDGAVKGAGFVERPHGAANGVAIRLVAKLLLLAETDQQDPVTERARNIVQQQRRARLSLHVAAANDVRKMVVRRVVEKFGGQCQFARFENSDYHTGTALLLRATTFYAKFHSPLLRQPAPFAKSRLSLQLFTKVKK